MVLTHPTYGAPVRTTPVKAVRHMAKDHSDISPRRRTAFFVRKNLNKFLLDLTTCSSSSQKILLGNLFRETYSVVLVYNNIFQMKKQGFYTTFLRTFISFILPNTLRASFDALRVGSMF